jgi:diguanylate cyclase (GGDEF)-like protein/hemerythrin-like metal-binding protein
MAYKLDRIGGQDKDDPAPEPAVLDLIERFPLPVAMLDHAGETRVTNEPFKRRYRPEILHSQAVQEAIRDTAVGWKTLKIHCGAHGEVACRAQTVDLPAGLLLILDDSSDGEMARQLDQLHEQVSKLQRLSSTDVLTGAWNRSHFERTVVTELERSIRQRQPVSLILIDIDHFKRVNDNFGHQTGDSVLSELVSVVEKTIRSIDMLFRWGGEEFVVIAPSAGYRGSAAQAERIREAVAAHRFATVGSVTVSIGVAEYLKTESAETWFRRLDHALYQAKDGGRNRVWVERIGSSDSWAAESGRSVVRLVWQEAYECGEPNIDEQHHELFTLANAALDASFRTATSRPEFEAAIDKLLVHIVKHFTYEEQVLEAHHYVDFVRHVAAHDALVRRTLRLRAAAAIGQATFGELVDFLANKVVALHLFTSDKKFFSLFSDEKTQSERKHVA